MSKGRWEGELVQTKKDGRQILAASRWSLQRDERGSPIGFLETNNDITNRKRAEEALKLSESYLTQAQRVANIGSWVWEVAGREAVYLSEEWYRVYGFDPKDGMPSWEERLQRVHPEDRVEWQAAIERAIAEKSDYDLEFRISPLHAEVRYLHSVGRPVLNGSGELVQFIGVSMDVTESKRAEEERERLRRIQAELAHINRVSTLGELTASLAHEIKQPIGAAVTNAETCVRLLDRSQPDIAEAREAALETAKDARRAADIIDRVRSLFQKSSSEMEVVDINEAIEEMVIMLQDEANRHSIVLRTDLAGRLPKVMADRVQLQQVLLNLMLNGIEAMQDASGELIVKSQLADDAQLLISVADTGLGLPAGNVDKIFDAFFTTKPQGTGLGLAITRSIVKSHSGRIWATANSGRGATFHFTLPSIVAVAA
jgi:PAS domain S-box-containing protein